MQIVSFWSVLNVIFHGANFCLLNNFWNLHDIPKVYDHDNFFNTEKNLDHTSLNQINYQINVKLNYVYNIL